MLATCISFGKTRYLPLSRCMKPRNLTRYSVAKRLALASLLSAICTLKLGVANSKYLGKNRRLALFFVGYMIGKRGTKIGNKSCELP